MRDPSAATSAAPPQERPRHLGDAWRDWDARRDGLAVQFADPPFLYAALYALVTGLVVAAVWLLLWLAQPRLAQLGLARGSSARIVIAVSALIALPAVLVVMVGCGLHPRGWLARTLQRCAIGSYPVVEMFARRVGFSRDQVGHAFLELVNRLAGGARKPHAQPRLLVLAPRCLRADLMRELRVIAGDAGAVLVVAAGGEEARAAIAEVHPAGVLAIACERDLVAGVREAARARPVLTVANRRPEGPCRNSAVDLEVVRVRLAELARLTCPARC